MINTHPLWRPFEKVEMTDVDKATIGGQRTRLVNGSITIMPPQERWHEDFLYLKGLVASALGEKALAIEHIGSTSVEGLHAKPIIDMDLLVADSSNEESYLQDLTDKAFVLTIREPEWEEHRMFKFANPACNLHVFSRDSIEYRRHVAFRDWLNENEEDRLLYGNLKRSLALKSFDSVMAYNNEKAELIYEIYERIFMADSNYPHDPHTI